MSTSVPALPGMPAGAVPGALDGVITRRLCGWLVDIVVVTVLTWFVGFVMVVTSLPTMGLSFLLAPLLPLVGVFYAGLTMSGRGMGTWGMRMFDLKATTRRGEKLDFVIAAGHALIFWLTLPIFALPSLIALFNAEKRTFNDYLTGVIVTRRTPLT